MLNFTPATSSISRENSVRPCRARSRRSAAAPALLRISSSDLIRRVRAAVDDSHGPLRRADPSELRPVELHFLHVRELIEVETRRDKADRQAVRLGDAENIIRRRQRTRARHVLQDDIRLAGDMRRHGARQRARPQIADTAREKIRALSESSCLRKMTTARALHGTHATT